MAIGSDVDFFGFGAGGGYGGGYLPSLLQPWQRAGQGQGQSPYVGYSSFVPQTSVLPATARGFLEQYIPELGGIENLGGQISGEVQDLFKEFRFGGSARDPGAAQGFVDTLLQREDIQGLLRQTELQEEGAFLRGQNVQGARSLSDIVAAGLADPESQLENLYGTTGFKQEQITEDLRRFAAGEDSGIGNLSSKNLFGSRGQHTEASRMAVLAQLVGGQGPVDIGGGQVFNPYSYDILSDEYRYGTGVGGDIEGHDVLTLGGGILSLQDADISGDVAQKLAAAQLQGGSQAHAFGGKRGYRLAQALENARFGLQEGQAFGQGGALSSVIDQWYRGHAGSSFGRGLPVALSQAVTARQPMILPQEGEPYNLGDVMLGGYGERGRDEGANFFSGGMSSLF
jgi:hypothetical protein